MKFIGDWLRALIGTVPVTPIPDPLAGDPLVAAGREALEDALACHALGVDDPKHGDNSPRAERGRHVIEDMIRSPLGLAWTRQDYDGNGDVEWCAAAWTRWWGARLRFSLKERATYFASTYRLDALFRGESIFGVPCPVRPGRKRWAFTPSSSALPAGCEPRAGDCLIVGDGKPWCGDHVTLVRGWDAKRRMFLTVEGNAVERVNGKRREGVILGQRPLGAREGHSYLAMFLYRPSALDLA